jgi:hypothetical protein
MDAEEKLLSSDGAGCVTVPWFRTGPSETTDCYRTVHSLREERAFQADQS